jgi:hypothetical protein
VLAEMNPDRDWIPDQLASPAPPHVGNFQVTEVKCFAYADGISSPGQDFPGPIRFRGHHSRRGHDSEAVLIEFWGDGTPAQEGPLWHTPRGVHLVCVWSHLFLTWFFLLLSSHLNSKCDFWIRGVMTRVP